MNTNRQILTFQVASRPVEPRGAVLASAAVMALVGFGRWLAARLSQKQTASSRAPVTVSAGLR